MQITDLFQVTLESVIETLERRIKLIEAKIIKIKNNSNHTMKLHNNRAQSHTNLNGNFAQKHTYINKPSREDGVKKDRRRSRQFHNKNQTK